MKVITNNSIYVLTTLFSLSLNLFFSYSFLTSSKKNYKESIAIGSQGNAETMIRWIKMYYLMESNLSVALYVLSYDIPVATLCLK